MVPVECKVNGGKEGLYVIETVAQNVAKTVAHISERIKSKAGYRKNMF